MLIDKWDYRIADVISASKEFITETNYGLTYDQNLNTEYLYRMFNDPESSILAQYDGDTLQGFAIVTKDRDAHVEWFGYIVKFYVLPIARGTTAARELMQDVVNWFDAEGCYKSFTQATAGVSQDARYINLCRKFEYNLIGGNLIRNLYGQDK